MTLHIEIYYLWSSLYKRSANAFWIIWYFSASMNSCSYTGAIRRFIRLLCAFSCLFYREGGNIIFSKVFWSYLGRPGLRSSIVRYLFRSIWSITSLKLYTGSEISIIFFQFLLVISADMLYNVLVGFVFAQLHYTTKKAASFFSGCSLFFCFFTAPSLFIVEFSPARNTHSRHACADSACRGVPAAFFRRSGR